MIYRCVRLSMLRLARPGQDPNGAEGAAGECVLDRFTASPRPPVERIEPWHADPMKS
nr:hypothetical protein GCM10020063_017340 [Dactylosporangium thailandense]